MTDFASRFLEAIDSGIAKAAEQPVNFNDSFLRRIIDIYTKEITAVKDFLGNEIHVGDEIVYAAHWSNVAVLTHARVVAIDTDELEEDSWTRKAPLKVVALRRRYEIGKPSDRVLKLSYPDRCVVVKRAEAA